MTGSRTALGLLSVTAALTLGACTGNPAAPDAAPAPAKAVAAPAGDDGGVLTASGGGRGSGPVIYVTSQELYFDSILNGPLPFRGKFQKLEMGPNGLQTEFGPGDPGHRGGRWWVDENGNRRMDSDDSFFSCPLLGPGRAEP